MHTWTYPEAHPVGPGPWEHEPDKAHWIDQATDLDCLIVRGHHGAFCGYVGIPPGHPWYDVSPFGLPATVHGGLNYGARCREEDPEPAICHVPEPGRPTEVYWVGFDCSHDYDYEPTTERNMDEYYASTGRPRPTSMFTTKAYRTFDYVRDCVRGLAAQIAQAGS